MGAKGFLGHGLLKEICLGRKNYVIKLKDTPHSTMKDSTQGFTPHLFVILTALDD